MNSDFDEFPLPKVQVARTKILSIDANSPDNHVPRDPKMIRLTGNHPFNSEAPLTDLFAAGASMTMIITKSDGRILNTNRIILCTQSWACSPRSGRPSPRLGGFN